MRVAVVGAGISGLVSAYVLTKAGAEVVLYEKEDHLGGHARTAVVDGIDLDLGFMVFNPVTYPNLMELFETLGVDMEASDMSFSVSLDNGNGYEWGTRNGLSSLFSQKKNLLNHHFCHMLWEVTKFKDDALRYLEDNQDNRHHETLQGFIKSHGYSQLFQKAYLVPMCSSIWPYPEEQVRSFSAFLVLLFLYNHHNLQVFRGPQWLRIRNSPHTYVEKLKEHLECRGCRIRTSCSVEAVSKLDNGCLIICEDGSQERYNGCIIATHAQDALKMIGEQASYEEKRILGAFNYVYSDAYLHRDTNVMPQDQTAWSACNFYGTVDNKVCLTYWLNVIQNINHKGLPFLVTTNPHRSLEGTSLKWSTRHLVPSVTASKALLDLHTIQGKRNMVFCGAYQGDGLHEDGVKAGIVAANIMLNKSYTFLNNPKQMVPSLMEVGARSLVIKFLRDYIVIGTLICLLLIYQITTVSSLAHLANVISFNFVILDKDRELGEAQAEIKALRLKLLKRLIEEGGSMFNFEGTMRKSSLKVYVKVHNPQFYWKIVTKADIGLGEAYINGDFSLIDKNKGLLDMLTLFIVNSDLQSSVSRVKKRLWTFIAKVNKNHEVLDIGCGWGAFAIEIVKKTGCKYTGITLSKEQIKYAQSKVKEAGLQDRIRFLLCDYRQIPDTIKYDRIISCEAIEHFGHEYYQEFFACCEAALAEDGIFVLQFISVQDRKYDEFRQTPGFVREYIFPGGNIPSLNILISAMTASSRLSVDHVEKIGTHYVRTLRCWRANFLNNQSKILALGFNQEFIRTWEYYFDITAAGFKTETLSDYQVVFSRPRNINAVLEDP
ncbi:hypothetical protein QVD17_29348 [Tagetes erecta]|uniref:Amine oxidase domain-containing protein n=1 Tax=Tagetes erecta TaxID=13708 RepID=A0AAD8NTC8_TARER|nr:hypothetical protein QVD17_29348 [Tagetes erecta]